MNWLAILSAVLAIARALAEWMRESKLIDAGTAIAVAKGLQESNDAIDRAQKARALVRDQLNRDPASVRDDDGFKRPD